MLNIQEVVNFVNSKLNELGTESDYSFDIHAEIGENQNNGKINGILYTNQASTTPIPDYTENNYVFVCELLVPSARANKNFIEIQKIVESFIENYDGKEVNFTDGDGLLNVSPSKPENFNVGYNAGENVPLFFTISVLYTESSVTSADAHWFLDGYEIPYTNESIIVDREGNVNKINNVVGALTKTFLTSQTLYFRFTFPYSKDWHGHFLNDMLLGDITKEYTLSYYDGKDYTSQAPYTTKVKVFKNASVSGQRGKVKTFDITFAQIDSGDTYSKYYIALIDNPFDNQTENTRWFEDTTEVVNGVSVTTTAQQHQQAYFNSKVGKVDANGIVTGTIYQQIKAPNLNSIDITSQIYPNNGNGTIALSRYELFDLANKNYAIIKVVSGSGLTQTTRYFYYFVTNCQIGAENQVLYDLKLDTIQTYMFDPNIQFSDCYIERSNLNRWVAIDANTIQFDGTINSKLFEREKLINVAKRLTKRTNAQIIPTEFIASNSTATQSQVNEWLKNNVLGWVYIYADPTHSMNFIYANSMPNYNSDQIVTNPLTAKLKKMRIYSSSQNTNNAVDSGLACMCYPIYKNDPVDYDTTPAIEDMEKNHIVFDPAFTSDTSVQGHIIAHKNGFDRFLQQNNDYSYIYSVKISSVPPFSNKRNKTKTMTATIDATNNILRFSGSAIEGNPNDTPVENYFYNYSSYCYATGTARRETSGSITNQYNFGLIHPFIQESVLDIEEYTTQKKLQFLKSEIVGTENNPTLKNSKFNPKLLCSDYYSINVGDNTGDNFEYDLQKVNSEKLNLVYSEPLTADITRNYLRLKNGSGLYIPATSQNFTGFSGNSDNSVVMVTSAYQSMLANQKNYYQQNALKREYTLGSSMLFGALGGAGSSNDLKNMGFKSVLGMLGGALHGKMSADLDKAQEAFTIDNMKNAPSSIQNAKGNVYLNEMATGLGVYIEEYDVLPQEKEIINDAMVTTGFTTNQIGQLKDYLGDSVAGHKNKRKYFNYIQAQVNSISGIPMSNVARADMRQRFAEGVRFWKQDNVDYTYENYEVWLAE